jgi:hypothetical protein
MDPSSPALTRMGVLWAQEGHMMACCRQQMPTLLDMGMEAHTVPQT